MSQTFRFRLFTVRRVSDPGTLRVLWRLLGEPLVKPQAFDSIERARIPFRPDALDRAARLYDDDGILFVKGGQDSFLAVFTRQPRSLATWDFWLDVRALQKGEGGRPWLEWVFSVCDALPVLYGFGCSVEEYEAKHRRVRRLPGGRTARGAVGVAIAQFWQFLPGIYWLTIFGAELVRAFGKEKPAQLPGVETIELAAGQVAILSDGPAVPDNMEERLKQEQRIADILGPTFFFDRNRAELQFEPVPALLEVLNRDRD